MGQGFISKYILRDIAGFIRKRKGTTDEIKPVDMAEELESIPTFEDGIEQGKQAEYDRFWDAYQENGNRTDYRFAFAGFGWTEETILPKYPIIPTGASGSLFQAASIVDLKKHMDDNNIVIDLSKANNIEHLFRGSQVSTYGVLDVRGANNLNYALYAATTLTSVDKIIINDNGSQTFTDFCNNSPLLVTIIFEGVIGKSGLNLKSSTKLSKASIESIINCLSTTTSGLSITLSKTAVNNAFSTEEWTALEQTRPNWTISLV